MFRAAGCLPPAASPAMSPPHPRLLAAVGAARPPVLCGRAPVARLRGLAAFALALVAALPGPAHAGQVLVAVAANFAEVLNELKPGFERRTGHTLVATTGSTGKLYAQIKGGAPFQVLLSADAHTPERLEREGLGLPGTRYTYALGQLALWSKTPGLWGGDAVAYLRAGRPRHVALANPELAPYGVAARETLQALGVWDALKDKVVMGQNIGQTHSLVATGAAEVGFVALSALKGPRQAVEGSVWVVPARLHSPIVQQAVLLAPGRDAPAARALLQYLKSDEARRTIEAWGYGVE